MCILVRICHSGLFKGKDEQELLALLGPGLEKATGQSPVSTALRVHTVIAEWRSARQGWKGIGLHTDRHGSWGNMGMREGNKKMSFGMSGSVKQEGEITGRWGSCAQEKKLLCLGAFRWRMWRKGTSSNVKGNKRSGDLCEAFVKSYRVSSMITWSQKSVLKKIDLTLKTQEPHTFWWNAAPKCRITRKLQEPEIQIDPFSLALSLSMYDFTVFMLFQRTTNTI